MRRRRPGPRLDDADLARREPVWKSLSTLWLGREPAPRDLARIAAVLRASGFSLDELHAIYVYEVAPSVRGRRPNAGDGSAFDEPWLYGRARRRAERRSLWLRLQAATPWGRHRLTAPTAPDWRIVLDLMERMQARSAATSRLDAA